MPFFPEISIFSRSSDEWLHSLYDNRQMCSIPAPFYYSIGLSCAHFITFPIYLLAFFALYRDNTPSFIGYKPFLAFHAISNFLFEFYLSVAMKPILYLPFRVARFSGLFFFSYLNSVVIMYIFLAICIMTCFSIVEMIQYRFKLVTEISINEKWVRIWVKVLRIWRRSLYILLIWVLITLVMCIGAIFEQNTMKLNLDKNFLSTYPELMCSSTIVIPIGTSNEIKPLHVFNFSAFFTLILGAIMCAIMGAVALLSLRRLMTKCSAKTIQMHKILIYNVFVQVAVHGVMLGFPVGLYVTAMFYNLSGNDIGYCAIIIASLHGAMSTLSMLFFNRPLYEILAKMFNSLFTPSFVHHGAVSFVSMDTTKGPMNNKIVAI